MKKAITVVGYPRSGNTWVARTLGDILESPVGGAFNAKPLCTEGQERVGAYRVQQLHQKVDYHPSGESDAYKISAPMYGGEPKILFVARDPRDIAVSAMFYWKRQAIGPILEAMTEGGEPLAVHGTWQSFNKDWLDGPIPFVITRYEDVLRNPAAEWHRIMGDLGRLFLLYDQELQYSKHRVEEAIGRQEFSAKKAQIALDGDGRPYGKTIQQHHLRKGEAGDWRNHFTEEQQFFARAYWGTFAMRLGYVL